MLEGVMVNNINMIDLENLDFSLDLCLMTTLDESKFWQGDYVMLVSTLLGKSYALT